MHAYRSTGADVTKILTRKELAAVLVDLQRKAPRSPNTRLNLILFRLATCCGLRVSEIASLHVSDVRTEGTRPHLGVAEQVSHHLFVIDHDVLATGCFSPAMTWICSCCAH